MTKNYYKGICLYGDRCEKCELCSLFTHIGKWKEDAALGRYIQDRREEFYREWIQYVSGWD